MAWLWAFPLNGVLGLAAYLVSRHGFRQPRGAPRILGTAVVAWTWLILGMEILGTLGLLQPIALLAWNFIGLGLALIAWRLDRRANNDRVPPSSDKPCSWETLFALGLVLFAVVFMGARSLLLPVKVVSDGPIYHLYFAARWWKAGRIFLIPAPFGESAATYFPAVGDLWFTWLMISWGGERLAKAGQVPFLILAGMTTYALARRLGAGRDSAIIGTCWFVCSTPFLIFSFEPNVDTIFIAGYLLTVYFFVRHALGDDEERSLCLGALAAGGALGSKAIGVVFVPALFGIALVAVLLRTQSWPRKTGAIAILFTLPLVMAGFWYGRNLLLTGNPLYPLHAVLFGHVLLQGWYGSDAMRQSAYYISIVKLRSLGDTLFLVFDPRLVPVWIAALLGAWNLRRVEPGVRRAVWLCAVLAVLNVAIYWVLIPYRTQQRFMLQAVALAAIPLAMMLDLSRWVRLGAVALLTIHMITPQNWPFIGAGQMIPWDLSPDSPSEIPAPIFLGEMISHIRADSRNQGLLVQAIASLGLGLVVMGTVWAWRSALARPDWRRWTRAAAATLVTGVLAVVSVLPDQATPQLLFFPIFRDYFAGWIALDQRVDVSGTRIAYAGTNLPYYLLGVGLRNEVNYVNIDGHRDWLMHDYHREAKTQGSPTWPNPRPAWDRVNPDYEAWVANLRAARIQVLVVARPNSFEGPHILDAQGFPIERTWAESHPETFEPLYGVAENNLRIRIYRVRAPSPAAG